MHSLIYVFWTVHSHKHSLTYFFTYSSLTYDLEVTSGKEPVRYRREPGPDVTD